MTYFQGKIYKTKYGMKEKYIKSDGREGRRKRGESLFELVVFSINSHDW